MPYTPPVGSVALHLRGDYTPPVGSVALHIGYDASTARTADVTARSPAAQANVRILNPGLAKIFAISPTARAALTFEPPIQARIFAASPASRAVLYFGIRNRLRISATSQGCRAIIRTNYDPNLLSNVVASAHTGWRPADQTQATVRGKFTDARPARAAGRPGWVEAPPIGASSCPSWMDADGKSGNGRPSWQEALTCPADGRPTTWRTAKQIARGPGSTWRGADSLRNGPQTLWRLPPRETGRASSAWTIGARRDTQLRLLFGDGSAVRMVLITRWRDAGYPGRRLRVPSPRPPIDNPTVVRLCIAYPLPGTRLTLGRRCQPLDRRYYLVLNSASLVRLPDRTVLPCTELTISADCDSWCWSLSATLKGGADLVTPLAPAYLPWEVEATINGYVWQFLLDAPDRSRAFVDDTVRLSGRSRAAWLAAPYTAASQGTADAPTSSAQAAELALENTGWAVDWSAMPDWLIPADVLTWDGTPIDRLIQLAKPVDGCLLADSADALIRAYLRYPSPPWEWTSDLMAQSANLAEAAIIQLNTQDDRRDTINGVYVGGTTAGVLASCKVARTAGDMQAEMVIDSLLCDTEGVAARARAISVLSQSGPGSQITAQTILQPAGTVTPITAPGLIQPGAVVNLMGRLVLCRGVSISASRDSDGSLIVGQTLTLEQRETEA